LPIERTQWTLPAALDGSLDELSVDRDRSRAYSGGVRFDVSELKHISATGLPKGGRTIVDPNTGRYATLVLEEQKIYVFDSDDTPYDSQALPGTGFGGIDVDPATGLFYLTTQGTAAQLVVYSEGLRQVVGTRPLDFAPGAPVVDPSSGDVYIHYLGDAPDADMSLRLDRDLIEHGSFNGRVLSVDAAQRRIFVAQGDGSRLEVRASETWALADKQFDTDAYWVAPDPLHDRLYVRQLKDIVVFDQASGAPQMSFGFDFPSQLITSVAFAPGDDRIYAFVVKSGQSSDFVLHVYSTQ
jgi:hypothetical protein